MARSFCILGWLLAWLLFLSAAHAAPAPWLPLSAPESPALWWALDAGPDDSATSPHALIGGLSAWLRQDGAMHRPRPAGGLRIGLLARVPDAAGQQAVRVLNPPHPLDDLVWQPAAVRHRVLRLGQGMVVLAGTPDWIAGQATLLRLDLPFPVMTPPPVMQPLQARLILPLDRVPARWPALLAGLAPDALHPVSVTAEGDTRVELDLLALVTDAVGRMAADVSSADAPPATLSLYLRVLPQDPDEQGAWRPWRPDAPARWWLGWQEPERQATGRDVLLRTLAGLLWLPGARPEPWMPADDEHLLAALTQAGNSPCRLPTELSGAVGVSSPPPDCGSGGTVLMRPADRGSLPALEPASVPDAPASASSLSDPAAMPLRWQVGEPGLPWAAADARVGLNALGGWLDRWRDHALAPPLRLALQAARLRDGLPVGVDAHWLRPVPGRLSWPGDHVFMACRTGEACPPVRSATSDLLRSAGLQARLTAAASDWRWLTDAGLAGGMALTDWRLRVRDPATQDRFLGMLGRQPGADARSGLRVALDDYLRAPVPATGFALPFTQPLPAGGAKHRLLWIAADGVVWQFDEDAADPGWAWVPARAEARWLGHRENRATVVPATVPEPAWQLWPGVADRLGAGGRTLYGIGEGGLMALDLDEPDRPRLRFAPPSGIMPAIGSLSLLAVRGPDGGTHPVLLLAAAASSAEQDGADHDVLQLVDGLSGALRWRAGAGPAAGRDLADPRLRAGWTAAWRALPGDDGQWLYGVDDTGRVWRLRLDENAGSPSAIALVAVLAGSEMPDAMPRDLPDVAGDAAGSQTPPRFPDAPSVAWLRDAAGARRPALAIGDQGVPVAGGADRSGAVVHVLLDPFRPEPLAGGDLPVWSPEDVRAPLHPSGWRWQLPGDARLASPPRWLAGQVTVTSAWPLPVTNACAPPSWQLRLHQLPWRRTLADSGEAATGDAGAATPVASTSPVLRADGQLVLPGLPDTALPVSLPATGRFRTGKRPLPVTQ